jgi:hypothetical protein
MFVIFLIVAGVAAFNYFVTMPIFGYPWWWAICGTLVCAVFVYLAHGIGSAIVYKFKKRINPAAKYFKVGEREKNLWQRLGVRKFKDLLPDGGNMVGFPKATIANPNDAEYIRRYIHESCVGEIGHINGVALGFFACVILPIKYWWCFGLPCAVGNAILGLLPIIVLRYNRYKLVILQKRLARNSQKGGDEK